MIRVTDEAKRLLSTLWAPDGEVMRPILRPPEADGVGGLAFGYGRGEGADQIVQHAGAQVLRVDPEVQRAGFDGWRVEVVDGTPGMARRGPDPHTTLPAFHFRGRQK